MGSPAGGEFSMLEHRTTGVLYFIVGFLGVFGNFLSLVVFWRENAISGSRGRLHMQVALANIMVVIGSFLSGTSAFFGKWLFGDTGCKLYGLETYTGGLAAIVLSNMLCYQRFFSQHSAEKYDRSGTSNVLSVISWLLSIGIGIGPLVGWNSYTIEASGTACGLDWKTESWTHSSMFIALCIINAVLLLGAAISLRSAFQEQLAEKAYSCDWFTNNQLNWVALGVTSVTSLGFTPYFYFSIWCLFNPGTDITMLASVISPFFAKLSAVFVPLVYILASPRFRQAYAAMLFGSNGHTGKKGE